MSKANNPIKPSTVTIKGEKYNIRWSLRAMMAWEEATGKTFNLVTLSDRILYLYCVFFTSNDREMPDIAERVTYDEFIIAIDDDESIVETIGRVTEAKKKRLQTISETKR